MSGVNGMETRPPCGIVVLTICALEYSRVTSTSWVSALVLAPRSLGKLRLPGVCPLFPFQQDKSRRWPEYPYQDL